MKPRLVLGLVAATLLTQSLGCVPCGQEAPRVIGIHNSPYCAQREAELKSAQARAADVNVCIHQGGDPVGCRAAIYGSPANRNTVNVQVAR
jgi:hypothetical protein